MSTAMETSFNPGESPVPAPPDKARVFCTQLPHHKDGATGAFVPSFNLNTAQEFGEVVIMMPSRAAYIGTGKLVEQLLTKLQDYDYERGDMLLLLGDPSIIAAAVAIVSRRNHRFAVLRWEKHLGRYTAVRFAI